MRKDYKTVKGYGEKEIVISKSRFIAYVDRAETEEEAMEFINKIKKKHHNATHNCSAYMIGEHDQIQKANDDGEPSGTAGVPILEVLKKRGLKDTTVVVTRYFGGIKLGAGGLIRAYASTTTLAINTTGVVERRLMQEYKVTVEYPLLGKIENEIQKTNYLLAHVEYTDKVTLHIFVNNDETDEFLGWMKNLSNATAYIEKGSVTYKEIDVPNP